MTLRSRWFVGAVADSWNRRDFSETGDGLRPRICGFCPPVIRRRHAEAGTKGAIQRPDRAPAEVECDGENWTPKLVAVHQSRGRRRKPVFIDKSCKVAVTKLLVDQAAQPVLRNAGARCRAPDSKPSFALCLLIARQGVEARQIISVTVRLEQGSLL